MSERIRDHIINTHPELKPEYIKGCLNKVNEPDSIEAIEDECVRNIKYAIEYAHASEGKIQNVCILTSDSHKGEYENNSHLKDIKHVVVKSGAEAIQLLDQYRKLAWER